MRKNLTQILKGVGCLLAVVCGIVAGFIALLALINLRVFDEALHPDLAALPQTTALPAAEGNAYYGLMGFRAAPDKDFMAAGQMLAQHYLENRAAGTDLIKAEDFEAALGKVWLKLNFRAATHCDPLGLPCSLEQLATTLRGGDYDRAQMDVALQRYDSLLAFPTLQYLGSTTVMTPTPMYQIVREAQIYALAQRYSTGSSMVFLKQVESDLQFWKRLLREGRWVLDKMVAVSALWTDMQVLSEYMTTHELSAADHALIDTMLVPLSADELDIGEAYLVEAQDLHNHLEYVRAHYSWDLSGPRSAPLLQPNATANSRYTDTLKLLVELCRLSAADYARTVSAPEYADTVAAQGKLSLSPANLYNLAGKLLLVNQNWSSGRTYIERTHEINAMMLAVRLQFELKGTAREQLADAVKNSALKQPYSGAAFDYDSAEGWLSFECRENWSRTNLRCRVKL